ncbi:hypothetical protein ID144_02825 [Pseudomonas sp. JM0905a]|uniref:hypothetical protein n=1 Tax=Pseudomonas sp. JM0905a TaxID=2772484 RepID=UPI00168988DD|nr:hypothetical protein [Pseudomonas sp. JM0905a]MBD2835973.1 hypothetical protein [Pseudomonas sp. JM0905a]
MAENSRSESLHAVYTDAISKFDHFLMGATLAVCGYLAQSNPYAKLGLNLPTLYLISLVFFALAAFCCYKRLEHTIVLLSDNVGMLEAHEAERHDRAKQYRARLKAVSRRTNLYYKARFWMLVGGFVTYTAAKVLGPYVTPCQPPI